ncbi:hypothetical protein [Streptomyces sp900105755]|uniref:Uncharacterized protein n=1 Tax=Streptomyces sp. 900105755 TaxID=3154389 RepID=A0ABV1TXV6_9ACTN
MSKPAQARELYDAMRTLEGKARAARKRNGHTYSRREAARTADGKDSSLGQRMSGWLHDDWDKAITPRPDSSDQLVALVRLWSEWAGEKSFAEGPWRTLLDEAQPSRSRPARGNNSNRDDTIEKASTADAAVHAALAVDRIQAQRDAADAFDKAATDVLRDARTAAAEKAWLMEPWPSVEDALNTLARTGPEEIIKAARDVHLLLTLLPQSAACCAAISYLNADERTALDQVAIAVQWAAGDINAQVRIAEERAHAAMECVQGMGGGFLWVHLREGLLLKDTGPRYQRAIGSVDVALREFRSLVRQLLNNSERD